MAPRIENREAHIPMYALIASKVSDEAALAYALDLYDAIEEARVLRQNELRSGNVHTASVIEEVRNRHITKLSELMSSCPLGR